MPAQQRILIFDVTPQVDCGRYPAKACTGDRVAVGATIVRDGHDVIRAAVRYRRSGRKDWVEEAMDDEGGDRFTAGFVVDLPGRWEFEVHAWVDRPATWLGELDRKLEAGQVDLSGEMAEGELLFGPGSLEEWRVRAPSSGNDWRGDRAASETLEIEVERELARFGAWYELFPRSWGGFAGVAEVVPALAELGFDVLYLPPVHPIGLTNRKGRNNESVAAEGDPGSPWAIGSSEGGHEAIHPDLGTEADFAALVDTVSAAGMELAIDFAIQTSPDHPWLRRHPEWFQRRPDGTIKYAENPPKRYQDIHNVDWDTNERKQLWKALRDVVLVWCERGVRLFRVDNPHTKPFTFWEWLIAEVRGRYPDTIFLSEAFTRPVPMTVLAKLGFSQSYTYFTWKNTKAELVEFVEQIRSWSAFYRPNMWPNTPDILHEYLQQGGRPAFEARLVLAATLSPSYGIYSGYEACERVPVRKGSEEYLDSEKYVLKDRRLEGPLLPLIRRLNEIRRSHAAFKRFDNLSWLETGEEQLLAYVKRHDDDVVIVVVNLDPEREHEGLCALAEPLGAVDPFEVTDLLGGQSYRWRTGPNYVKLAPGGAHVLRVDV